MWRPSLASFCNVLAVGALLTASNAADACLFPCLWGWGGYYSPPPMYGAPMYGGPVYGAPAYAPSPCGPGGCGVSPCGPGGCSSYYGPSACCAPCGSACACSPCGAGGCSTGNCGVNYGSDMKPQPDAGGPAHEPTYAGEHSHNPATTDDMPEDDFRPTDRSGPNDTGDADPFPFREPAAPPTSTRGGAEEPPAVEPMDDSILPGAEIMHYAPVRDRTFARARYGVPRVARLTIEPQATPWMPAFESRLANR